MQCINSCTLEEELRDLTKQLKQMFPKGESENVACSVFVFAFLELSHSHLEPWQELLVYPCSALC